MFTMKLNKINWLLAFNLFVVFAVSSVVSPRAEACPAFTAEFWTCVGDRIYEDAIEPIIGPVVNEFEGLVDLFEDYVEVPEHSFTVAAITDIGTEILGTLRIASSKPDGGYAGIVANEIYATDFYAGVGIRLGASSNKQLQKLFKVGEAFADATGNEALETALLGNFGLVSDIVTKGTGFDLKAEIDKQLDSIGADAEKYLSGTAAAERSQSAHAQPKGSGDPEFDVAEAIEMVNEKVEITLLNDRAFSVASDGELMMMAEEIEAKGAAAQKASEERDLALASDISIASENSLLRDRLLDFRVNQANVRIDDSNLRIAETNLRLDDTVLRLDNLSKRVDYNSRKASSGIASALAASTALAGSGNNSIGAGIGSWGGEQAISVSIKKSVNDKASISSSVSHTRFGTALSAGWNFNF